MLDQSNRQAARLPASHPPVLLIIVDAEEEFDWGKSFNRSNTKTTSIQFQKLLHDKIYDRFAIVPTYVVDYPVATTPQSVSALHALMKNHQCEIGAQLHPWVTPPHSEVVCNHNSYPGNLPPELEFEKIKILTQAIEQHFGHRPTIYKAGRYGLGPVTSQTLSVLGYKIDASVVPYTSYAAFEGPDFSKFSAQPFWFGDIDAPLLEIPVTTGFCGSARQFGPTLYPKLSMAPFSWIRAKGIAARLGVLERIRITPEGATAKDMGRVAKALIASGCQILTMTYHSPSVVPGHTPYVKSEADLDEFLTAIEQFCDYFRDELGGVFMSVSNVYNELKKQRILLNIK